MSMSTTIVYGYGVDKGQLNKVKIKALVEFLKNHLPKEHERMMEYLSEYTDNPSDTDYEGWLDDCSCDISGIEGKYALISSVMYKETDIRFEYQCSSENGEYAVMMVENMPWKFNKVEYAYTQGDIDELFKKYFTELGVEVKPSRVSVEYFG